MIFLTGREEIDKCLEDLADMLPMYAFCILLSSSLTRKPRQPRTAPRLVPMALHAGLSTDAQLGVFQAAERGTRKVIVSTNIAEVGLHSILFMLILAMTRTSSG